MEISKKIDLIEDDKSLKELACFLVEEMHKVKNCLSTTNRLHLDKEVLQKILKHLMKVNSIGSYLKYIDLSEVNFHHIDVSNRDFSGTNANINPQTVLYKKLLNTNLEGLNLEDKSFIEVDIRHANLKGTKANIDPQKVASKSLYCTNLEGLNLEDKSFIGVDVSCANLKDTKAKINPQIVHGKNLCGTNLSGLDLSEANFEGVKIDERTNLSGTGAVINIDNFEEVPKIPEQALTGCYIYTNESLKIDIKEYIVGLTSSLKQVDSKKSNVKLRRK